MDAQWCERLVSDCEKILADFSVLRKNDHPLAAAAVQVQKWFEGHAVQLDEHTNYWKACHFSAEERLALLRLKRSLANETEELPGRPTPTPTMLVMQIVKVQLTAGNIIRRIGYSAGVGINDPPTRWTDLVGASAKRISRVIEEVERARHHDRLSAFGKDLTKDERDLIGAPKSLIEGRGRLESSMEEMRAYVELEVCATIFEEAAKEGDIESINAVTEYYEENVSSSC